MERKERYFMFKYLRIQLMTQEVKEHSFSIFLLSLLSEKFQISKSWVLSGNESNCSLVTLIKLSCVARSMNLAVWQEIWIEAWAVMATHINQDGRIFEIFCVLLSELRQSYQVLLFVFSVPSPQSQNALIWYRSSVWLFMSNRTLWPTCKCPPSSWMSGAPFILFDTFRGWGWSESYP